MATGGSDVGEATGLLLGPRSAPMPPVGHSGYGGGGGGAYAPGGSRVTTQPLPGKYGGHSGARADSYTLAYLDGHAYLNWMTGRSRERGATPFQAGVNVMKLVVGVGSFALPAAFAEAGMLGGVCGIILVAGLTAYCVKLIRACAVEVGPQSTYFDIARATYGSVFEALMYIAAIVASV